MQTVFEGGMTRMSEKPIEVQQGAKCPECGCTQLIRDGATGEVVCSCCGLVVDEPEYVAPFVGKRESSVYDYTSFSKATGKLRISEIMRLGEDGRFLRKVGRLEGGERTEAVLASRISALKDWLNLPNQAAENAMYFAMRLLRAMRRARRRMSVDEVAAVSLWCALKVQGGVNVKEYEETLRRKGWKLRSLFKLITKASNICPLPKVLLSPADYVGRIAAKLEAVASREYVSLLNGYTRVLLKSVDGGMLAGKDHICTASTALCVADELLGGWVGREAICRVAGAGFNRELADALKENAPPPPPFLCDFALEFTIKRVREAIAHEDVRNGADRGY